MKRYPNFSVKRFQRIMNCSCGNGTEKLNTETGELQFFTSTCKDGLCPFCNEKKTDKEQAIMYRIVPKMIDSYYFCFITINYPSVSIYEMNATVKKLHKIYSSILTERKLKKIIKGSVSHIQYGNISMDAKINLHLHAVIIYDKSMDFNENYIKDVVNQNSDCIIENIYIKFLANDIDKIQKTINYTLKPLVFFRYKYQIQKYLTIIDSQRKKLRFYSFSGIYKIYRKKEIDMYIKKKSKIRYLVEKGIYQKIE